MAHHLLLLRRELSPIECYNPYNALCANCSRIELQLGTCSVLGETQTDRNIGAITAWGMFLCYLIPIIGVLLRKSAWIWTGLAPLIAIAFAGIFQSTIPSPRPPGACMLSQQSCGMPSGHCMTSYATLVFILLFAIRDYRRNGLGRYLSIRGAVWLALAAVFLIIQLIMAYGRVVTFYHTAPQAGWGFLAGALIGLAWFLAVVYFFGPRVGPWLERKLVCIGFKDDWNNPVQALSLVVDEGKA